MVDKKSSSDIDEVNGSFESPDTSVLMSPGSHLDVASYAYENIDTLKNTESHPLVAENTPLESKKRKRKIHPEDWARNVANQKKGIRIGLRRCPVR